MPQAPAQAAFPLYRRARAGDPEDVRQQFAQWQHELERCSGEVVTTEEERRGDMYLAARCLANLEVDLVGRDLAAEPTHEAKLHMLDTAEGEAQAALARLADEVAQAHGPRAELRDRLSSTRRLPFRSSDTAKFWRLESRIGNLVAQQFYAKLLVKHYDLLRDLCDHAERASSRSSSSSSAGSTRPPSFEDEPRVPAPPYQRDDGARASTNASQVVGVVVERSTQHAQPGLSALADAASSPPRALDAVPFAMADPGHLAPPTATIQEEESNVTRLSAQARELQAQQADNWDDEDERRRKLRALNDETAGAQIRIKELEWTQLMREDPERAREAVTVALSKAQHDIAAVQVELTNAAEKEDDPTRTRLKGDCTWAREQLWKAHRHAGNIFCSLHSHRLRLDAWKAWARRALPDYHERPPSPPSGEDPTPYSELFPHGRPDPAYWPRARHRHTPPPRA
ncbi:hypothetical protein JCM8208_003887 [Rhodotorula glutinis]